MWAQFFVTAVNIAHVASCFLSLFNHFPSHYQLSNHGSQSQTETQPDSAHPLDMIWVALSVPLCYHIIAVTHSAINQVNELSEIIFANAVLHLPVLRPTLGDPFWRRKQRGSWWGLKRIMRDERRTCNGNRRPPRTDFYHLRQLPCSFLRRSLPQTSGFTCLSEHNVSWQCRTCFLWPSVFILNLIIWLQSVACSIMIH